MYDDVKNGANDDDDVNVDDYGDKNVGHIFNNVECGMWCDLVFVVFLPWNKPTFHN